MKSAEAQAAGTAARRTQTRVRLLLGLAALPALAAVLLACLGPITSGDLWWHLRTGEWILAEGRLPYTDPFSHTAGDTHWVLQEYGSQVLFALVHRLAGFAGLGLLAALLSITTLVVAFRRARQELRSPWALALAAAFALLFALKWELRPHLISVLFFFWLEANLLGRGAGPSASRLGTPSPRRMLELFLISLVWVQLHAEALFAPLFALAVATGAWLAVLREGAGLRHGLAWLGMVVAALAGTLASPLFDEPHRYALVGRAAPQRYIEEWFRPWVLPGDPRFAPLDLGVWGLYLAALAVGGCFALWALGRRLRTPGGQSALDGDRLVRAVSWERLAFLAGCLLFALSARRFFWLTWFPLLDAAALLLVRGRLQALGRANLVPAGLALVCGLLLLGTHYPTQARASLAAGRFDALVDPALFPAHAADFATEARLHGNLYHPYEWGGYLGYVTEQQVYIDGRTVLFEEVIPERWLMERDAELRERTLDARGVQVIVFKHFVDHGQGWRPWWPGEDWLLVWTDQLARVFVRKGSDNAARAAAWWQVQGVDLDDERGVTEADVWFARPEWLRAKRILPAELVDELEAAEARGRAAAGPLRVLESVDPAVMQRVHAHSLLTETTLERVRFWTERRMKRNLRGELRRLIRLEEALHFGGYTDDEAILEDYRRRLREGDLDTLLEHLETLRKLAPYS